MIEVPEFISRMLLDAGVEEKINQFGLENEQPVSFSVNIPVKGNKNKIEQLISKGWERGLTSKYRTDNRILHRNQYDGYVMKTTLTYHLRFSQ